MNLLFKWLNNSENIGFTDDQQVLPRYFDFSAGIFSIKHSVAGFTVTGSSFLPGPAATTAPRCGFSFAVSGIIMPPLFFLLPCQDGSAPGHAWA